MNVTVDVSDASSQIAHRYRSTHPKLEVKTDQTSIVRSPTSVYKQPRCQTLYTDLCLHEAVAL
ncbi:hypothetical protein J6590_064222 [Homalodisca vitripennis]|nr:hypothetical protein J6590_064222 [Homalodisca vitripennis]